MSTKKNQKKYNKQVMQTGYQANEYLRNSLSLLNQYTTDYSGRLDYYTNKLNNRQLDLLSDKYLAENASMLRGSSAFGSNSTTARTQEQNAYTQQNYLANVANQNVELANQIQQNELSSLMNASNTYVPVVQMGGQAAQNVDAASSSWLKSVGTGLSAVGKVVSAFPGVGTAVGAGLQLGGSVLGSMATDSTDLKTQQYQDQQQAGWAQQIYGNSSNPGLGNLFTNLSTKNGVSSPNTYQTYSGTSGLRNAGNWKLNTSY